MEVRPGERKESALTVNCPAGSAGQTATIRIRGDFGAAGAPVLSLRLMPKVEAKR